MKSKWINRVLSGVLVISLLAATPVYARGTDGTSGDGTAKTSPLAKYFDESQLNPDYVEWEENGKQGAMPVYQDFSYLTKSYARLGAMQNALLPEEYDLRDYGKVEPVLDQNPLGICWAIAANSAAASPLMEQFPQTSFSPIHTTWFTFRGPEDEESRPVEDPYMAGGNDANAVAAMAAWKGPVFEERAPLNPQNQQNPEESLRYAADYHLQDAYYMPNGIYSDSDWGLDVYIDTAIIKQMLMNNMSITIHYYSSGMSDYYNEETSAWYNSEPVSTDHAVLIAGWDDNYPKENFLEGKQPEHDGAWLIRNSWGADWGDDGYFWLSYEDKSITTGPAYLLEEADNYTKNYQYDTAGWSYSVATDAEQLTRSTAANIFTAASDEQLEAVSFYTTDAGTEYSISVYTGVEEGQPESGRLALQNQTGTEPYAGYHTIELKEPVSLKAGERFSIVVTWENPEFESPLPIEWCPVPNEEYVPEHLGNGGESYVLSDGQWLDVAGNAGEFYISNVCIKGFTNPLPESGAAVPTVRFSEMEGPVENNTFLSLDAEGADEIWASVDGGKAFQLIDAGILLDNLLDDGSETTVSAYAVKDGKKGNTVTKTYTKAVAQLTDFAVRFEGGTKHLETDGLTEETIYFPIEAEMVQVMAQSGDTIYVNGMELNSSDWSHGILLRPGQTTQVAVQVEKEGKTTSTYQMNLYRSMLTYDYEAETIGYDESAYRVKDNQGNVIPSGGSISSLISTEEEIKLTVEPLAGGSSLTEYIPKRRTVSTINIDYANEQTVDPFSDVYAYSVNSDMSDATRCENGKNIPVTPGVDLYIQRQATNADFASTIYHLTVPSRPSAPKMEAAEVTETSVTLKEIEGAVYSNGGDWQESPVFTGLTPGKTYKFQSYLLATDQTFYSNIGAIEITLPIPQVNPSDYSFEVKYVDGEGNPVPGGGTITFDQAGAYSREDIPIPYEYMEIIPAHPDEDWLYPTSLVWSDGKWTVTNPVVEIMVEPKATVNIIFKTPDGNVLENLGYTEYFDSIGGGIETVTAPEGYEFIEGNTYEVDITRDEDGRLVAEPAEAAFIVKAIGGVTPSKPAEPQNGDTQSPGTGDNSNYNLWVALMVASAGVISIVLITGCRKKKVIE